MRKIIIKLPDEKVNKFRLQRAGWRGGRCRTAAGVINRLKRRMPLSNLIEKTSLVIKEGKIVKGNYKGTIVNETLTTDNPKYLLYCAACFLEDFLSDKSMRFLEKRYSNYER